MTPDSTPEGRPNRPGTAITVYIGSVALLGLLLVGWSLHRFGLPVGTEFFFLVVLAVGVVLVGDVAIEGRQRVSLASILLVAGQALLGPGGAGLLGLVLGSIQYGRIPARARAFNAAQGACYGTLAGLAFHAAGGSTAPADTADVMGVVTSLAVPVLVADVVLVVTNLVLVAGAIRITAGVPVRNQLGESLRTVGVLNVGYGLIALLLLVLWLPAGLGPAAIILVLAPVLVAQWAYRQHAEELHSQDRVLQVLVAAIEAKAPHLVGHSGRVAALAQRVAEAAGVGPQGVTDVRLAGMLHDLGQTTLPTSVVRGRSTRDDELRAYPGRGVEALTSLEFLHGALDPISRHRDALDGPADDDSLLARIVGLADDFDLLTEVGTPEGGLLSAEDAVAVLRQRPGVDDRLVRALEASVTRSEVRARP